MYESPRFYLCFKLMLWPCLRSRGLCLVFRQTLSPE
ncbi:hypothetical protein [Inovirus D_HF38_14]|nr:hypothetical protein [Inovirus D_HF38_14]